MTRKHLLILSSAAVISALILSYLFISDISEFSMPANVVRPFYIYTGILLSYTVLAVVIMRRYDSRYPRVKSKLRKYLRITLGSLWLLDGILQIQPEMSFGFAPFVLLPALQSLPAFLQPLAHPVLVAWSSNGSLMDSLSAVFQIFLGLSFLNVKSGKYVSAVAALSLAWAVLIWIFGEDMGSITIGVSLLTGFPGAALLYAVPSVLLLLRLHERTDARILKYTFAALFLISAVIQAIPSNGYWNPGSIAAVTGSNAYIYEPGFLSYFLYHTAMVLNTISVPWNLILVISFLSLGFTWALRPRAASWITLPLTAAVWVLGQDFGILGGYGTDPNTALVILLISTCLILYQDNTPSKAPAGSEDTTIAA